MSLTREAILEAAYEVVRRHGPSKATVVDVAQALGVSHGSIYRFFPTKAALREAVVEAWLKQITNALASQDLTGDPVARLRAWFEAFHQAKRTQRAQEPELFEAFRVLTAQEPAVIGAYKLTLEGQIAGLLASGIAQGAFRNLDADTTARALLNATLRFHHPAFAHEWGSPEAAADFDTLWDLLVRSITTERIPS